VGSWRALLVARVTRASAKVDFENNPRLHPFLPDHAGTDTVIDVCAHTHTHTDALKGCTHTHTDALQRLLKRQQAN